MLAAKISSAKQSQLERAAGCKPHRVRDDAARSYASRRRWPSNGSGGERFRPPGLSGPRVERFFCRETTAQGPHVPMVPAGQRAEAATGAHSADAQQATLAGGSASRHAGPWLITSNQSVAPVQPLQTMS